MFGAIVTFFVSELQESFVPSTLEFDFPIPLSFFLKIRQSNIIEEFELGYASALLSFFCDVPFWASDAFRFLLSFPNGCQCVEKHRLIRSKKSKEKPEPSTEFGNVPADEIYRANTNSLVLH